MIDEKLCIEDYIDSIHDMLDKAWDLPLSGGRSVVDSKKVRNYLEKIRKELPVEIKQAQAVVSDRHEIIEVARREAEAIIKKAEAKAQLLISEQRIVTDSKKLAEDIVNEANAKAREAKNSAIEFTDGILKRSEDELIRGIEDIKKTRSNILSSRRDI